MYNGTEPFVTINKYPVQIIAIESCKQTLDSLLDTIEPEELTSCLCQVIMTLVAYQKAYQFTHNDLHTNNIMYVETDVPFLYYFVEDTAYQVPTYGKIYKIIDFGRSVYTFQGKKFISDSFSEHGDAATQYNTEPYFNPSKPRLEPNYSFDLCRLACSMVDMLPDTPEYETLNQLIEDWCTDDKGRNVVYKKNGEERYPGFKLYKMIARTVHEHVPLMQLRRPIFQNFIIKKKKLKGVAFLDLNAISEK
jgi:serine/threonine protein kinase